MNDAIVGTQPQYVLVAQTLIEDIQRGRHKVGGLLPPELELCTQFGVSRHTVREAMRLLLERGLVTRQRGIGTIVKARSADARYVQSTASIADLPRYVEDTRLEARATEVVIADEALAELLKCPVGQRWLHVTGFRYAGADTKPIALSHIYVNASYAGIEGDIGRVKVPVYTLIERKYGESVAEVSQQIAATLIGAADARLLDVKRGSAGLLITRRYVGSHDRVIEVAINLHPADRFSYSMSLRLKPPAGR